MSDKLKELQGQLQDRQKKLHDIFEEAGPEYDMGKVKSIEGDSQAKVDAIKALNTEMDDLRGQIDELQNLASMKQKNADLAEVQPHPGFPSQGKKTQWNQPTGESFGELVVNSGALTKGKGVETELKEVGLKTVFGTAGGSIVYTGATAGWYPADFRSGVMSEYALGRTFLRVADLIPKSTTMAAAITYFQEQSFSNAAVEVTEGSAKPEAALDVSTVTEPVRKIAVWIPATDEQLADVPQARSYLDNRLAFMVRLRLDGQILTGNGTAPNLKGILNRSGLQAAQAKGSDPAEDAIYKEITKIRVNDFSEPNAVVMHPNDWQDIRLHRTADGIYIWGSPSSDAPETIWGLRVVQSTLETENTALVGDFNQAELAMREGLTVRVTDSHASYFTSNIQVVLVEMRVALLVYREGAFGTVTGI